MKKEVKSVGPTLGERITEFLVLNPSQTATEIAKHLNVNVASVSSNLKKGCDKFLYLRTSGDMCGPRGGYRYSNIVRIPKVRVSTKNEQFLDVIDVYLARNPMCPASDIATHLNLSRGVAMAILMSGVESHRYYRERLTAHSPYHYRLRTDYTPSTESNLKLCKKKDPGALDLTTAALLIFGSPLRVGRTESRERVDFIRRAVHVLHAANDWCVSTGACFFCDRNAHASVGHAEDCPMIASLDPGVATVREEV